MKKNDIKYIDKVNIITTARLHMGFFDLNGALGRQFGSIGVSLDKPLIHLEASRSERFVAEGLGAQRAVRIAEKMAQSLNFRHGLHMRFTQTIPEHAGLGSGTQMSLAVGMAINRLYGLDLNIRDIARLTARGARSGIGLGTFAAGGAIVDGGRGPQTDIPPVIARAEFPEAWRIVLIFDHTESGVHGDCEMEAFRNLPEFPAESAAILCRHVLMQALPALAEHDLKGFGAAIRQLQQRTGDYFAPAQGGQRYASPRVAAILNWLDARNVACVGQSSWGPTGFAIFPGETEAQDFIRRLKVQFAELHSLEYMLCKGRNHGAVIQEVAE